MRLAVLFLFVTLLPASFAHAQVCEEDTLQMSLQYLRRLNIDLAGAIPNMQQVQSVVDATQIFDETIDELLSSDAFVEQIRKYHLDLLWTNFSTQKFANNAWVLREGRTQDDTDAYWIRANGRATHYRGGVIPCKDEPVEYDEHGAIATTPYPGDPTLRQEGFVEVEPWWAPGTSLKVCAFEAQVSLEAPNPSQTNPDRVANCSKQAVAGCGCGENLRWCHAKNPNTMETLASSLAEQTLRFIDDIVRHDKPYTDVLLGTGAQINGPISHWLRHQTQNGGNAFITSDVQDYNVLEIPGSEVENWQPVERYNRHAGVLTLPGYLVKFQTNRSRANRFHQAFLCQSFQAPEGGLPSADDACNTEPDLQVRCGCKYCHAILEPDAAHWGRFAEAGLLSMDEENFPMQDTACADPDNNNFRCRLFYLRPSEATHDKLQEYIGTLYPYVFADDVAQENIELGPRKIAEAIIERGDFALCTVKKLWAHFMHRPPTPAESAAISALANEFASGGYNFRALVKSIVTRPEYMESERFGWEGPS